MPAEANSAIKELERALGYLARLSKGTTVYEKGVASSEVLFLTSADKARLSCENMSLSAAWTGGTPIKRVFYKSYESTKSGRLRNKRMPGTAALVVVGDVGHSPRMNYHALSLADHGMNVEIIGYLDSNPHQKIRDHPRIRIIPLKPPPKWFADVKPTIALGLKVLWTAFCLMWALMWQATWRLSMVMIQNPPGIPGLVVSWLVCKLKGASFVIDWHNYTWSILRNNYRIPTESLVLPRKDEVVDTAASKSPSAEGESLSPEASTSRRSTRDERQMLAGTPRPLRQRDRTEKPVEKKKPPTSWIHKYIQWAYNWEGKMGRAANVNICVTKEMRSDLAGAWNVRAVTLYDKAPSWNFKELSIEEKHVFFEKLCHSNEFRVLRAEETYPADEREVLESAQEVTRFSYRDAEGVAHLRESRPLILLSSTSWTEDEDFGILLDALKAVESVASISSTTESAPANRLPHFCVIITGKGPQKAMYLDRIARFKFRHVDIIAPWLEAEDYPKMLASADLGVSLHTSTSGIDLPMKVVDMFGCKLPVLAKSFRAIHELVVERENESSSTQQASPNGRLFDNSGELKAHILDLATGFPSHAQKLHELRVNIRRDYVVSWADHWDAVLGPVLKDQWE
uniref:Glyco_trans_4-like_N domain-containing protein n=1 Tax=Steinernema glaseri TaxID=37863 RepID=A0A1I7ZC46_9BILA